MKMRNFLDQLLITQTILFSSRLIFYTAHFLHFLFSRLLIFYTAHFLDCSFSTLLIFQTAHFLHCSFSTLLIFYTPYFLHCSFSTLLIFYTPYFPRHSFTHFPHSTYSTTILGLASVTKVQDLKRRNSYQISENYLRKTHFDRMTVENSKKKSYLHI